MNTIKLPKYVQYKRKTHIKTFIDLKEKKMYKKYCIFRRIIVYYLRILNIRKFKAFFYTYGR